MCLSHPSRPVYKCVFTYDLLHRSDAQKTPSLSNQDHKGKSRSCGFPQEIATVPFAVAVVFVGRRGEHPGLPFGR